VNVRS